jgi:hypothetical protein
VFVASTPRLTCSAPAAASVASPWRVSASPSPRRHDPPADQRDPQVARRVEPRVVEVLGQRGRRPARRQRRQRVEVVGSVGADLELTPSWRRHGAAAETPASAGGSAGR